MMTIFRSERMDKLLSFSQVRILPQEEVSCLRSDGVRVEGDRNTGATPDKRDPRPKSWVRATVQPVTQVNLVSLVNVSHAVMLGEHGVGRSRRVFRMGTKASGLRWMN